MATPTPKHLFRCSSDQSNGTNTPTLFAPGRLTNHEYSVSTTLPDYNRDFISLYTPDATSNTANDLGHQLRQALIWKKDQAQCPFIFFTTSPIFVIELAAWRAARKTSKHGSVTEPDTNVNITIIDTETARTSDGALVHFQSVSDLVQAHDVELRNRGDGSLREYADQWVAMSTVVPRQGSFHASLRDLVKNGFYELYPQIEAANERRGPRPSLTTDDLRKYFFSRGGDETGGDRQVAGGGSLLMRESLDTAARVAMCFQSCAEDDGSEDDEENEAKEGIETSLAFVLSLRKRNLDDLAFRFWAQDHTEKISTAGNTSDIDLASKSPGTFGIPDADEFVMLEQHFSGLSLEVDGLAFGLSIDLASIQKAKADWACWWKSNREEYRASHPRQQQRKGWRDRRTDRPRELFERRARRNSVVAGAVQGDEPRELFPRWRDSNAVQNRRFGSRSALPKTSRRSGQGYRVLTSRPGDATTTRQQHQLGRIKRRRDQDGVFARGRGY